MGFPDSDSGWAAQEKVFNQVNLEMSENTVKVIFENFNL